MNKKVLITILLVVLAVAVIAVLIMEKSGKNEIVENVNNSEANKEIEMVENTNSNKFDETEERKDYNSLTEEEKSELVWYEVSELGVRFKVTPDYKNDVKYYIKRSKDNAGEETAHAFLYSQSEIDFKNVDIDFNEDNEERDNYTLGILSRNSIKYNQYLSNNDFIYCSNKESDYGKLALLETTNDRICFSPPQAFNWGSIEQYEQYLETLKDEKRNHYFETMEEIK